MANITLTGTKSSHIQETDRLRANLQTALLPQVLDLSAVPGIRVNPAFIGSCTDGLNGYLSPFNHGVATCINLSEFKIDTVKTIDLSTIDSSLIFFGGCFYIHPYVYYIPRYSESKLVRIDVNNFTTTGVSVLNLFTATGFAVSGCLGGCVIARNLYFVSEQAQLVRVDSDDFSSTGVTTLNLLEVDSTLDTFYGSFSAGKYLYLVPFRTREGVAGKIARIDITNFSLSSVEILDLVNFNIGGFCGGIVLNNYAYFVPFIFSSFHGKVLRLDLNNFNSSGVSILDVGAINPLYKGFAGGITDGEYIYLSQYINNEGTNRFGNMMRIDPLNFSQHGVVDLDLGAKVDNLGAYLGGFADGEFIYFTPIEGSPNPKLIKVLAAKTTFGGTL